MHTIMSINSPIIAPIAPNYKIPPLIRPYFIKISIIIITPIPIQILIKISGFKFFVRNISRHFLFCFFFAFKFFSLANRESFIWPRMTFDLDASPRGDGPSPFFHRLEHFKTIYFEMRYNFELNSEHCTSI